MTIETGLPANDTCCADAPEQARSRRQRKASSACIPRLRCRQQPPDNCGPASPPVQYSNPTALHTPAQQEARMNKIAFPSRASTHLFLLRGVAESGAGKKSRLQVV